MPRGKKFTAEQIIGKLREAEVGLAQGKTVPEVVWKLGLTKRPTTAGSGSMVACVRTRRSGARRLSTCMTGRLLGG